jgi:hypothetical protein
MAGGPPGAQRRPAVAGEIYFSLSVRRRRWLRSERSLASLRRYDLPSMAMTSEIYFSLGVRRRRWLRSERSSASLRRYDLPSMAMTSE